MADVFVSYKREDREAILPVVNALEAYGLSVWWDNNLTPRETWDATIEREIEAAAAVLVLWTPRSVKQGTFVRVEADFAKEKKKLVGVVLQECSLPIAFRLNQHAHLVGWDGSDLDHPEWQRVLAWVSDFVENGPDELPSSEPRYDGNEEKAENIALLQASLEQVHAPVVTISSAPLVTLPKLVQQRRTFDKSKRSKVATLISICDPEGLGRAAQISASLAHTLPLLYGRRVLVVDFDWTMQTSILLFGPEKWDAIRESERTFDFYLESYVIQQKPKPFKTLIQSSVLDIVGCESVGVIASAPELRNVERAMIEGFVKRGFQIDMIQKWLCERLANGLKTVISDYDYILLVTPMASLLGEAALIASDAIVVTVEPSYAGRIGLISFRKRTLRMINERRAGPTRGLVLAFGYDPTNNEQRAEYTLLRNNLQESMFQAFVPSTDSGRERTWSEQKRSFREKYGASADAYEQVCDEFIAMTGPEVRD